MNQNGDPSQAWIKIKPDGRVDVFSGTSDIGNGSKTIQSQIVAETLGVPYDWITYDNSNTDSSPLCTGTFASRATFVAGNAVRKAALDAREKLLEIAGKELEIDPADLEVVDGEVIAKGAPQKKISVPDVAAAATWASRRADHRHRRPAEAVRGHRRSRDGRRSTSPPHSAISYAACAAEVEVDDETGEVLVTQLWQCFDVGRAINPTLVEGQIEGGAHQGLGLAVLENCYPYYPSVEHRGAEFGSYRRARNREPARRSPRSSSRTPRPTARSARRASSEMANNPQPPAIAAAVYDAIGVWVTELPITPERVLKALAAEGRGRRRAEARGKGRRLRRGAVGERGRARGLADSASKYQRDARRFGSWNGVEPFQIFPTVQIHAIGGDQVLMCRVVYEPGTTVPRHAHEHTEQLMVIIEGDVTMTIGDETRTLGPGDVAVVNRGVEHELYSEGGLVFFEALAPVPLDHVPDRERDLVLGADAGAGHVER